MPADRQPVPAVSTAAAGQRSAPLSERMRRDIRCSLLRRDWADLGKLVHMCQVWTDLGYLGPGELERAVGRELTGLPTPGPQACQGGAGSRRAG